MQGANEAGAHVERLDLRELAFCRDVEHQVMRLQPTEPDIDRARRLLGWAEHVVLVYPTWWGTMPSLLKGFLDRVLLPGFAFRHAENAFGYEGLLGGRSAHVITTMDTPTLVYRLVYRSAGYHAIRKATLNFCGIAPVRITPFGSVLNSDEQERSRWFERVRREGRLLRGAVPTRLERLGHKALAWLAALRLQFYPSTALVYALGALAAAGTAALSTAAFWIGYAALFTLEAATVLINELYDYGADRSNRRYGPFNGGSRVLIDGRLGRRELQRGAVVAVAVAAAASIALVTVGGVPAWPALPFLAALAVVAVGYTLPPLKLSYRTLGELDVAYTHGPAVLVCGWLFMGGMLTDPRPWLMSLPIALATLPSITLSNVPDREADASVGKRTIAARFGQQRALDFALVMTLAASVIAIVWSFLPAILPAYDAVAWGASVHGLVLARQLLRARRETEVPRRMTMLMITSLTFVLWFILPPLWLLIGT